MKRLFSWLTCILILLVCMGPVMAGEYSSSMSTHKDNYFVAGGDDAKFQVSVKYNLLYPFSIGWYVAYTELAFWDIYEKSAPFKEFNHNPETFWQYTDLGAVDFIRLGFYEHKSNGEAGEFSRGFDRGYGEIQLSGGSEYNIGLRGKGWYYYKTSSHNKDIDEYLGNFEAEVFMRLMSTNTDGLEKARIYVKGGGQYDYKGWIEAGIITRLITSYIQPKLFLQGYYGYAQGLTEYDKKECQLRGGLLL